MSIEVVDYSPAHENTWNEWCTHAENATFLHTRLFLSYHKDRFEDVSTLLFESGKVIGILPAAKALHDKSLVVSHPGITYGGIIHQGWLSGDRMLEAFNKLKMHYSQQGFNKLLYKAVPYSYSLAPSQDDLYALFLLNAQRVRCDLSCSIDLSKRRPVSERRRRGFKKSMNAATYSSDAQHLEKLWHVLAANLAKKHNASPVHSLEELQLLIERFPHQIQIRCALVEGHVEAGVIFFNSTNVWHAQYIASSEKGYAISALDTVFEYAINEAKETGARYFDFGTSNENNGLILNEGLYRFKSEFGGGGIVHEYYELIL